MRIILDLDCVLADFVKGASLAHGLSVADLLPHWPLGQYCMQTAVGRAIGRVDWRDEEFWGPLDGRREFWADLPTLPWTGDLLRLVGSLTDDWYVATSNSDCPECVPGKQEWCNRVLGKGRYFDRMIPTRHKHLLSRPGVVLIDDYDLNCERFRAAGGEAIVFPAHHNSRHEYKTDPMSVVSSTLKRLV